MILLIFIFSYLYFFVYIYFTDYFDLKQTITITKAPSKPHRMPTIKLSKKPSLLQIRNLNSDEYDINAPNLNIASLIDLANYECSIIKDRTKHLDRLALIEANQLFLLNVNNNILQNCCKSCVDLIKSLVSFDGGGTNEINSLAMHLAKCFTYNDLKMLRFNVDFGLGIFTGLELVMLPHGEQVRLDIIERFRIF